MKTRSKPGTEDPERKSLGCELDLVKKETTVGDRWRKKRVAWDGNRRVGRDQVRQNSGRELEFKCHRQALQGFEQGVTGSDGCLKTTLWLCLQNILRPCRYIDRGRSQNVFVLSHVCGDRVLTEAAVTDLLKNSYIYGYFQYISKRMDVKAKQEPNIQGFEVWTTK